MKAAIFLAIVLSVFVAASIAGAPSEEKKKIVEECKTQENASDEDAQQILNRKIPQGPNAKCFLACIDEKTGVTKDGKVNGETLKAVLLKEFPDAEKIPAEKLNAFINEIVADCQTITNPQRCDLSYQLKDCLIRSYSSRVH